MQAIIYKPAVPPEFCYDESIQTKGDQEQVEREYLKKAGNRKNEQKRRALYGA